MLVRGLNVYKTIWVFTLHRAYTCLPNCDSDTVRETIVQNISSVVKLSLDSIGNTITYGETCNYYRGNQFNRPSL